MKQILLTGLVLLFFSCGNKTTENNIEIDKPYFLLGTLNDYTEQHIFETDLQKISFVTGTYTRFSSPEETGDSIYTIKLADSDSKAQTCTKLLKELGCTNIEYIYYKDDISNVSIIHFIPTSDLKKYFDQYAYLR